MKKNLLLLLSLIIVFSMIFSACAPTDANAVNEEDVGNETESEEAENTDASDSDEVEEVENAEVPTEPMTITFAMPGEPDTLDPHKTARTEASEILGYLGASLVAKGPDGNLVPYLAESWEISEDGLTYTFHLRDDVVFHNDTPLTAKDFVYTYERAVDPETASPTAGTMLASARSFEAPDDYTFVIKLAQPLYPFLFTLAAASYLQPLSQAYVEEIGDELARKPVGVGPYKLADWQTGDKIVLEVNPEYTWGPEELGSGPFLIDYIEYRIIPEQATIVAGVETGEIDFAQISNNDLQLFEGLSFDIIEVSHPGLKPHIAFNTALAPFDNLNIRKALNMAIDRAAVLEVLYQGEGVIRYGPLSPSMIGYWEEVEEYGYAYNPDGAKALLEEEGYELNAEGVYEKDGTTLSFVLLSTPDDESIKFAELAQVMLKDIGVEITIQQEERAAQLPLVLSGDYDMSVFGYSYSEADIMYMVWHSSNIGGMNYFFVNNPELDELLELTRTATDSEARQQAVNEAQKLITEEAYFIGAVAPNIYYVMNQKVKNYGYSQMKGVWFNQAYIE